MDAADALVLPSELESFGNVALEAMGRGRIAVVTNTCGIVNWPGLAEHMVVFELDTPLWQVLEDIAGGRHSAASRSPRTRARPPAS